MAGRATVNISITPELDAFLQSRGATGRCQTTSDSSVKLLRALKFRLRRSAAQAERGELIDGDHVFDKMRSLIGQRRKPPK